MGGNLLDDEQVSIDDPVKVYLAEVDKVPPLTRAEEILCIQRIRAGDQEAESSGARLFGSESTFSSGDC